MRIQHMREFVTIHDEGNFSRAARSLYMTQPALSRHVKELERELGVRLIDRDRHSVRFTEQGMSAYKSFRKILRTYDALEQEIVGFKQGMTGTLRLGMLYYTIRQDFGDSLDRFAEEYPNVELKRFSWQPQEIYEALAEERIDLGVLPRATYPDAPYLAFQDILSAGMEVMVLSTHRLARKESVTLDDLRGELAIQLRDDPHTNLCYNEALGRCGFVQERCVMTDNCDTVPFEMRRSGAIYIKARGFDIAGCGPEVVTLPIEEPGLIARKSFAWRTDNENPLVPLFLEMARQ